MRVSHKQVFLMTFLFGWLTYGLKLIGIMKLLQDMGLEAYPPLMIVQAILLHFSLKGLVKVSRKVPLWFYGVALLFSGGVVFLGHFPGVVSKYDVVLKTAVAGVFYLSSVLAVALVEMTARDLQTKNISLLKNPRIPTVLCLVFEAGFGFGAAVSFLFLEKFSIYSSSFHAIPVIVSLPFVIYLAWKSKSIREDESLYLFSEEFRTFSDDQKDEQVNLLKYPFVTFLIAFSSLILMTKYFQGFAVIVGLQEWKAGSESGLEILYSKFSLFQSGFFILALGPLLFMKHHDGGWSNKVKVYFSLQSLSMGLLVFFPTAIFLVGSGIFRKILQRTLLNRAIPLLDSSLPAKVRLSIRNMQEQYGQLIACIVVAMASSFVIYGPIPELVLWLLASVCCFVGLFVRKKLVETLNDFQVSNLIKGDIFEAVNSCYSLANEESKKHHKALVHLLEQEPHPDLAKALIHSLGQMRERRNIRILLDYYYKHDREEIQAAVIKALRFYRGYEIDLFLKKVLNEIATGQTKLGEARLDVFRLVAKRIPHIACLTLLDTMEKYKDDEVILSNAVLLLGDLAAMRKDQELFHKVAPYLGEQFSRRIRVNAIFNLYHHHIYHTAAVEALDTLITSTDSKDRSAVAFLAGSLGLKGLLPYIIDCSRIEDHRNSTHLVALLKLGYDKVAGDMGRVIMYGAEGESLKALHQLHAVGSDATRFKVYESIMNENPNSVGQLIMHLERSRKDFSFDKKVISREADRIGLEIPRIEPLSLEESPNVIPFNPDIRPAAS